MDELAGNGNGWPQIRKSEERYDGGDATSRSYVFLSAKSFSNYGTSIMAVVHIEDGEVVGSANAAIARAVGNDQASLRQATARQTGMELEELVRAFVGESIASGERRNQEHEHVKWAQDHEASSSDGVL